MNNEIRVLAAMAYGEASTKDDPDEIRALASVLMRQRDARGYSNMTTFVTQDKTFSYVVADGNVRYKKLMRATEREIANDRGMAAAVLAAENAMAGGADASNGAYFWDGADIASNYANHPKVKRGIHFTAPSHNIYNIVESKKIVIATKTIIKKSKGKIISRNVVKVGRYDHVYDSTAAYGGTIFWKFNPDYISINKAKEYK